MTAAAVGLLLVLTGLIAWNRAATVYYTDFGKLPPQRRNMIHWLLTAPEARQRALAVHALRAKSVLHRGVLRALRREFVGDCLDESRAVENALRAPAARPDDGDVGPGLVERDEHVAAEAGVSVRHTSTAYGQRG